MMSAISLSVRMCFSFAGRGGGRVQERFQCTYSGGSLQQNHPTQSYAGQWRLLFPHLHRSLDCFTEHCYNSVVLI